MKPRVLAATLLLGVLIILCGFHGEKSFATSSLLSDLKDQYPAIVGTRLDSCSFCHSSGSSLNTYGQDWDDNSRDFSAVESFDSDGDTYTNIEEINALTFPGDSGDMPTEPTATPIESPQATATPVGSPQASADLNYDGVVDAKDLLLMQEQWQTEGVVPTLPQDEELVRSEVVSVEIPADNQPVVTYTLLDADGEPFDPETPGLSIRWLIAKVVTDDVVEDGRTYYQNYITEVVESDPDIIVGATAIQPGFDSGGTLTDLGNGQFSYKFGTAIEGFDPTLTHVVGGQVEVRDPDTRAQITNTNPIFTFRPDGGEVTVLREVMETKTCNSCHNPISAHGGGRKEYQLCVLCHNPGMGDPESGNSIDMAAMIHKIHMGASLPSVQDGTPYVIYGYRSSVHDYSHVVFPQDNRNCTTCHTGTQADFYKTYPSRRACGSCHDNVVFTAHYGGQTTDANCSGCHSSADTPEFGISIPGAHVVPTKSTQLAGMNGEILEVQNAISGGAPQVKFRLFTDADEDLTIDSTNFDLIQLTMAGPTVDYATVTTERVFGFGSNNATDNGDGTYTYQFAGKIPGDAEGTFAFGMEARGNEFEISAGKESSAVRESIYNPVVYVALDGGEADSRREIIDFAKCNTCHDQLTLHGSLRKNNEYCVLCHNPNSSDISQRPAEEMPPVSIDFKLMIHKIHAGEELNNPYVVYGFGGSEHDYSHLVFPGDLRDCESCHLSGTYFPPAAAGTIATTVTDATGNEVSRFNPTTTACAACHDSEAVLAHALSNTAAPSGIEACGTCHGQFRSEAVDAVHALAVE